ncbi:MAG: glycosyltransferase, partial [Firmicutes bacterium]|nr:glycosyltransferase [Bacillota bacterium]
TNNVFEIEWRNDFAWARNQHLKRAKGEWFFKLDADEIFEDVQNIVDFFNSGEYKNYGTATVKINEIIDTNYIQKHLRLFKIIDGMQWHDKTHERLLPYAEPTKHLNSYCLHYGNMKEVVDEKNKHEKYLTAVLEIYNEEPHNYKNIYTLALFYINDDLATAREYAEMGLKLAKDVEFAENFPYNPLFYPVFVHILVTIYDKSSEYQNIIDIVDECFNLLPKSQMTENAYILKYQQSLAFMQQNNFLNANNAMLVAYDFKKQMDNNEMFGVFGYVSCLNIPDITFIISILKTFVLSNLFDNAINWFESLPMTRTTADSIINIDKYDCYANFVNLIAANNPKMLGELYCYFADKYSQNSKEYSSIINLLEIGVAKNPTSKIYLANIILEKNPHENMYTKLQQFRVAINETQNVDEFLAYFAQQPEIPLIYEDVLIYAQNTKYFEEISQKLKTVDLIEIFDRKMPPVQDIQSIISKNNIQ